MAENSQIILFGNNHRYKNIKQLDNGETGFGQIHLVENLDDNKQYALKVLKFDDQSIIKLFFREIEIYEELNKHENDYIPKIYDHGFGIVKRNEKILIQRHYLVLDFFENDNLSYYIKKTQKGFEEREAKIIFKKILEGIKYCHEKKICHLDIKPDNILLDNVFNPKIIDFGLSDYFNEEDGKPIYNKNPRGTTKYLCPEIFKIFKKEKKENKKLDFSGVKADIYSLGEVLLNLVTNKYGYDHRDKRGGQNYDLFWNAIKVNLGDKELSEEFKKLYIWMNSYDPKQRASSIEEILKHPWFKEINELKEDEYEKLNNELVLKFLKLKEEIGEDNEEVNTKPKKGDEDDKSKTKGFSNDDDLFFPLAMQPKKFDKNEFVNNFMKIKGYLNPAKFMNSLAEDMKENFDIKASKDSLQFEASFLIEGSFEIEENSVDILKGTKCAILISLVKSDEDEYIVQFLRKEGEIEDYYDLFLKIKEIIKKKLS